MRLFILSDSPPEKDIQWSEQGMIASYKFVQKFWLLHQKILKKINLNNKISDDDDLIIYTNRLIQKISFNLEKFNYNVIIANIYETYNFLNKEIEKNYSSITLKENYLKILILMMPVIPHIITEAISNIDEKMKLSWPIADPKYLEDKFINIVIQINGKKKSLMKMEKDLDNSVVLQNVKKDKKISNILDDKNILKHIIVKNKLINFIIK